MILIMKYSLTISIGIICGFWIRRHLFKKLWILETHHIHRYIYTHTKPDRKVAIKGQLWQILFGNWDIPKRPLHPNSFLRADFNTEIFCHYFQNHFHCQFIHRSFIRTHKFLSPLSSMAVWLWSDSIIHQGSQSWIWVSQYFMLLTWC